MTKRKLTLISLVLVTVLISSCNACRKQIVAPANSPGANKPLPTPLRLSRSGWILANNQRMTLADFKDKVVVLDFYATWCEPCRAETPMLVKLQQQYSGQGLQIIGLNVGGDDDRDKVPAFAKEFGIQYPLGFPEDDLVDQLLSDNENIPQSFVFDRN